MERFVGQYRAADIGEEVSSLPISSFIKGGDISLQVNLYDGGPYEIAEPRAITALETYIPSRESEDPLHGQHGFR